MGKSFKSLFGSQQPGPSNDRRLYILDDDWTPAVNRGSTTRYCYHQNPNEDFFHLILNGEVFLSNGDEVICLNCAIRRGIVTHDRMSWQRRHHSGQTKL